MKNIRQRRQEETADYHKMFTAEIEVLEYIGIAFGSMFQGMADSILESDFNTNRERESEWQKRTETETKACESVFEIMFLNQACTVRYGELRRELNKDFLKNKNNYPNKSIRAYKCWKIGDNGQGRETNARH